MDNKNNVEKKCVTKLTADEIKKTERFVYNQTQKENWVFRLYANNNEVLAHDGTYYADEKSCKAGIESVRKWSAECTEKEKIEDQTLKVYDSKKPMTNPKWEIYKDKEEKFRFRLRANNGNLIAISESGYASKATAVAGTKSVTKWAATAPIYKEVKEVKPKK